MNEYESFLEKKTKYFHGSGFCVDKNNLHEILFDFQKDFVALSLKKGRFSIFAGTGLGKTLMEVEYCLQVITEAGGFALIITPLAVSDQTIKMANELMDINIKRISKTGDIDGLSWIYITNYEKMHNIDFNKFKVIVFDESSIFKGGGELYKMACEKTKNHDYILCATAQPAPNDFTEFGRHAELLRIMRHREMKDRYFVKEGDMNRGIRLKKHAVSKFWKWVASWSVICRNPTDLNYKQNGFDLPTLNVQWVEVETDIKPFPGELYKRTAKTLQDRQKARAATFKEKTDKAIEIINQSGAESWLFWVNRLCEGDHVEKTAEDFIQVKGKDKEEDKIDILLGFASGKYKRLVTKPTIAGHGMNWQICHKMIFFPTDSFEQYYQAIRRIWRYGQKKEVDIYMITADIEGNVKKNLLSKEKKNEEMYRHLIGHVKDYEKENLGLKDKNSEYMPLVKMVLPGWLKGEKNGKNRPGTPFSKKKSSAMLYVPA
jgi:ERCC4-related helicase